MDRAHIINAEHKDIIHDVSFDYYGERIATCSTDQFVKVWDKDEEGNWYSTASWKAHNGPVWKVTWADPEYYQLLATCSFDRTVSIWEETSEYLNDRKLLRLWVRRANLVDSRKSVTDVKFGPKSFGLVLATCSADGFLRIYEAPDVMNIAQWPLQYEVSLTVPCSCLTWNPLLSLHQIPNAMIAVGSDDNTNTSESKVFICEYNRVSRQWTKTKSISTIKQSVNDIIFAPNMGRSFYLLGVATKKVHILKIKPIINSTSGFPYTIETLAVFKHHYCTIWRLAWNITGTVLASSGNDGCVRLWKPILNTWSCVGVVRRGERLPQTKSKTVISPDQDNLMTFQHLSQITRPDQTHKDSHSGGGARIYSSAEGDARALINEEPCIYRKCDDNALISNDDDICSGDNDAYAHNIGNCGCDDDNHTHVNGNVNDNNGGYIRIQTREDDSSDDGEPCIYRKCDDNALISNDDDICSGDNDAYAHNIGNCGCDDDNHTHVNGNVNDNNGGYIRIQTREDDCSDDGEPCIYSKCDDNVLISNDDAICSGDDNAYAHIIGYGGSHDGSNSSTHSDNGSNKSKDDGDHAHIHISDDDSVDDDARANISGDKCGNTRKHISWDDCGDIHKHSSGVDHTHTLVNSDSKDNACRYISNDESDNNARKHFSGDTRKHISWDNGDDIHKHSSGVGHTHTLVSVDGEDYARRYIRKSDGNNTARKHLSGDIRKHISWDDGDDIHKHSSGVGHTHTLVSVDGEDYARRYIRKSYGNNTARKHLSGDTRKHISWDDGGDIHTHSSGVGHTHTLVSGDSEDYARKYIRKSDGNNTARKHLSGDIRKHISWDDGGDIHTHSSGVGHTHTFVRGGEKDNASRYISSGNNARKHFSGDNGGNTRKHISWDDGGDIHTQSSGVNHTRTLIRGGGEDNARRYIRSGNGNNNAHKHFSGNNGGNTRKHISWDDGGDIHTHSSGVGYTHTYVRGDREDNASRYISSGNNARKHFSGDNGGDTRKHISWDDGGDNHTQSSGVVHTHTLVSDDGEDNARKYISSVDGVEDGNDTYTNCSCDNGDDAHKLQQ